MVFQPMTTLDLSEKGAQIETAFARKGQAAITIGGLDGDEFLQAQMQRYQLADVGFVLDNENGRSWADGTDGAGHIGSADRSSLMPGRGRPVIQM